MFRSTVALLTLSVLGAATPALAAEIDEVAPSGLSLAAASLDDSDALNRAPARSAGRATGKTAARAPSRASSNRTVVHTTPGRPGQSTVHTTPGRPGRTTVHTTPGRPGNTVVHTGPGGDKRVTTVHGQPRSGNAVAVHHGTVRAPGRPGPVVSGRPGPVVVGRPGVAVGRPGSPVRRPVVVHRPVVYTHVRPYHGVFVYGPRPVTHVRYVGGPGPAQVARADLPSRAVNRDGSFALGLKGGSLISGSADGGVYSDAGLGVVGRYRPEESIGLELGVVHHNSPGFASEDRAQTQVSGSLELFAFPWTRVSPYVLGGATYNIASISSSSSGGGVGEPIRDGDVVLASGGVGSQLGLHAGLGLEFALGQSAAIDLEGRYIGWVGDSAVNPAPGAFQGTVGLLFHF